MRVFRPTYKQPSGKSKKVNKWWVEFAYHDAAGTRRVCRAPAFTDRRQSEHFGDFLDRLVACRASGAPFDATLVEWIPQMPHKLREKLVRLGMLTADRASVSSALHTHLHGEFDKNDRLIRPGYKQHLEARNRSPIYIRRAILDIERMALEAGFVAWADITEERVQAFLAEQKISGGMRRTGAKHRTINNYIQAIKGFCNWAVHARRITHSPLQHVKKVSITDEQERRGLTIDEARILFAYLVAADARQGMTGHERGLLYRLAIETGLRAGELKSLRPGSFDLGDDPTVKIMAGIAKNRKQFLLHLSKDMAAAIKTYLSGKSRDEPALPVPETNRTARMIRGDLADARDKWIEASTDAAERKARTDSDFLSDTNHAGEVVVFHSLRHTRGVWLFQHYGANPREVQDLMRLSTVRLVDKYAKSFKTDGRKFADRGPSLGPESPPAV